MIKDMYEIWLVDWEMANPGLTRSVTRTRMNETLCQQIANDRPSTRFFAKKPVPSDWSLNREVRKLTADLRKVNAKIKDKTERKTVLFTMRHRPRKGGPIETHAMFRQSVLSMNPKQWYTDEVMNAYMALLSGEGNPASKGCRFMSTYFYDTFKAEQNPELANAPAKVRHGLVKAFTRKTVTTGKVKIFVPVNVSLGGDTGKKDHWIMIMIDVKNKSLVSMDSKGRLNAGPRNVMMDWIEQEHKARRKKFDRDDWTNFAAKVPKQKNGYDCGPFACMFAAFMSNDKKLTFLQGDLPQMRARIALSILHAKL